MSEAYQVDLTNCDREPIHILGTIQPIGFLIALSRDWIVTRSSANSADFIGLAPDALIGRAIADIFTPTAVHNLRNRLALLRSADTVERACSARRCSRAAGRSTSQSTSPATRSSSRASRARKSMATSPVSSAR